VSIIQHRRGTANDWYYANPILASAELGYIIYDTAVDADNVNAGKFKIGDGTTAWNDLPIASGDVGPMGPQGTYYVGSTPPADPVVGDMWFNDTNAALSIYYDSFWVETTGQQGPVGPAPITSVSAPLSITGPTSSQTISISDASETDSGVITTGAQTIAGNKTFSGTISLPSTTSIGNVSATEIAYMDGVTSSIQTQLGTKANLSGASFTGSITSTGSIRASSINKVQSTSVNISSTFTSTTQFTSLMSITITTSGNPVLINVTGDLDLSVDSWAAMRILRNGTTQTGSQLSVDNTANGQNLPFSISVWDDVAAGTHTYTLQGQIRGSAATGTIGNVSGAIPVLWAWEVGA
jgi:hypothetical protein